MNEIKEYLESLLDDFNGNMIDLKKEMDELNIQIKENTRFMELLKEENDQPFTEFSPRNSKTMNDDKIADLENTIKEQSEKKENLQIYIDQVQEKIDELMLMIGKIEIYEIDNGKEDLPDNDTDINSEKEVVRSNIDTILSFLPADPMRAKIELESLRKSL